MIANMVENFLQLIARTAAWLTKGVHVEPAVVIIATVAFAVLWIATSAPGENGPPRCSNGE